MTNFYRSAATRELVEIRPTHRVHEDEKGVDNGEDDDAGLAQRSAVLHIVHVGGRSIDATGYAQCHCSDGEKTNEPEYARQSGILAESIFSAL